ncbi:MAG TPA: heparinase II/III family protein [Terrimicrobiaceae bacterium]|nr:heparinase II/III family protein [Terrimicrobiaceae bacterium]
MNPSPITRQALLIIVSLAAVATVVAAPSAEEDYNARAWHKLADGGIEYDFAIRVKADTGKALTASITPEDGGLFALTAPASIEVPAGGEALVPVKAVIDGSKTAGLPPFTPDTARVVLKEEGGGEWSGHVVLRLGTPGPIVPPGKEFLDAVRGRAESQTWAKTTLKATRTKADAALEALGSPVAPPTEGRWVLSDFHVLHWPKYVAVTTDEHGVKTCPICNKSWTPEQLKTGGDRIALFQQSFADLSLAAMVTGDERYAQAVREMLLGIAKAYPGYEVGPQKTRLGLNYLSESRFDREAVVAMRRLRTAGLLSDNDLKTIADGFLIPSLETIMDRGDGTPNIMMLRASAVGQAGLVLDWPPYVAWALRDKEKGMIPFTEKLIGSDGGWREGSLSYHMTTSLFMTSFPVELKLYGYDVMQEKEFGERLRNFYRFPMLTLRPDGRLVAIADAGLGSPSNPNNAAAFWLTREASLLPWLNKDLEFSVDDTPEKPSLEFKSRNFPDFGVAILHDGGEPGKENWVLVRHGAHVEGHGHFDILNAVAYVHGQPMQDDLGSNYSDPRHFGWMRNTVSHCTINIDEEGQMPTTGKLEVFSAPKGGPQVLFASDEGAHEGVRLERAVVLVQGVQLYIDRAVSEQEHTFDWIFTCYGRVAGSSGESKEIPPLPGRALTPEDVADNPYHRPLGKGVGYEVPQNLREMNASGNWWLDWKDIKAPYSKGDAPPVAMRWMAWSSGPARVVWGDTPGMGLKKPDEHRWVMARQKTRDAVWVTAMVPQSQPPLVDELEIVKPSQGNGLGVRLKSGVGGAWVAVNWQPGQPLKVGPISTTERIIVQP